MARHVTTIFTALLLAACGAAEQATPWQASGKGDGDHPLCQPDPAPGTTCSVAEVDCQRRIWRALACTHPDTPVAELPPIAFEDGGGLGPADDETGSAEVYLSTTEMTLEALGIATPTRAAAGSFNSDTGAVTLDDEAALEHEQYDQEFWWMFALTHELVHMVQGEMGWLFIDPDSTVELAVVEGEAQLYAMLTARAMGIGFDIEAYIAAGEARLAELVAEDFGAATAALPYFVGQRLAYRAYQRDGHRGVEQLHYGSAQRSAYEVLFEAARPAAPALACEVTVPGSTDATANSWHSRVDLNVWHVVGLLKMAGAAQPMSLARAWRDGQAFMLRSFDAGDWNSSTRIARWRTRWADPATARQVFELIHASYDGDLRRTVELDGADVIVSGTTGEPAWSPDPLPLRCEGRM